MVVHQQCYIGEDGYHFPDTFLGSALYYSLDLTDWFASIGGSCASVEWSTEDFIDLADEYKYDSVAFVKLITKRRGTFKVQATIRVTNSYGRSQTNVIPINLRVY